MKVVKSAEKKVLVRGSASAAVCVNVNCIRSIAPLTLSSLYNQRQFRVDAVNRLRIMLSWPPTRPQYANNSEKNARMFALAQEHDARRTLRSRQNTAQSPPLVELAGRVVRKGC